MRCRCEIPANPFVADFPMAMYKSELCQIYFDNASTTLKPQCVIDAVTAQYTQYCSNVFRGGHLLGERNTDMCEAVRAKVALFVKCKKGEVVFTKNCTDAINMVANGLCLKHDDEVIVTVLEHHSNFLPWQHHAKVKVARLDENGCIDVDHLASLISPKTKVIAVTHASNVTGAIQPVDTICQLASKKNIISLIDATQIIGHRPINVTDLGCDFLAFSAHKMLGPSGVGVLYGKQHRLKALGITNFGGGMVNVVRAYRCKPKPPPFGLEAGTPNIEGIIGFGAALDYIQNKGFETIDGQLDLLEKTFMKHLKRLNFVTFPFPFSKDHVPIFTFRFRKQDKDRVPIFTFRFRKQDVEMARISHLLASRYAIAINTGVQCCQPLYQSIKCKAGLRASLYIYNTVEEIEQFFAALCQLRSLLDG